MLMLSQPQNPTKVQRQVEETDPRETNLKVNQIGPQKRSGAASQGRKDGERIPVLKGLFGVGVEAIDYGNPRGLVGDSERTDHLVHGGPLGHVDRGAVPLFSRQVHGQGGEEPDRYLHRGVLDATVLS